MVAAMLFFCDWREVLDHKTDRSCSRGLTQEVQSVLGLRVQVVM